MTCFMFDTQATMKEYNAETYWIDSDIVPPLHVSADSVDEAVSQYCEAVEVDTYIQISKTARKRPQKMYKDTTGGAQQVGYVFTASTGFEDKYGHWTRQFIDLWVTISETKNPF